jgi:hypothetical protein
MGFWERLSMTINIAKEQRRQHHSTSTISVEKGSLSNYNWRKMEMMRQGEDSSAWLLFIFIFLPGSE